MKYVTSQLASTSTNRFKKMALERSSSLPEMRWFEVPHTGSTIRRLKGMAVQVEDWHELPSKLNQSRLGLVKLDQEAKVGMLTRRAVRQFVHWLPRQQFKVAVLTILAYLRLANGLKPPKCFYRDPITHEKMCDPVKCNDGRTYDRWTVIYYKMTRSPFTRRPFEIAVDDVDVRSWLFSKFPQQELLYRAKRADYRAKALQHPRSSLVDVKDAVEMLNNVLQWAPEDTECRNELDVILRHISRQSGQSNSVPQGSEVQGVNEVDGMHRLPQRRDGQAPDVATHTGRSQTYVFPTVMHEDLVRERYAEEGRPLLFFFLFVYLGLWSFLLENQRSR